MYVGIKKKMENMFKNGYSLCLENSENESWKFRNKSRTKFLLREREETKLF